MKKYMICFVSALVLGFSSCDLMDLKPLDQLSEEDVWNDEELLQLYVNGCYNALQHGYRYIVSGRVRILSITFAEVILDL